MCKKLANYLGKKRGLAAHLGRELTCHPVLLSQWAAGRPIPIERCVPLERATQHELMRWDLRPNDWWEIWPELIDRPGAPSIPNPQSEAA